MSSRGRSIFPELTVEENLLVSAAGRSIEGVFEALP